MTDFPFDRLLRRPDVEAENLQAHDATDLLLVARGLESDLPGEQIAVIGDGYGAITLALTDAGRVGVRVHQDLATGRRALVLNAAALRLASLAQEPGEGARRDPGEGARESGEGEPLPFSSHELDETLLEGVRLVLVQLPKSLAELEQIADAVARWAAPDAVLIAGGRVKHMTLAQNEVLGRSFALVQPQRAERKSRLIVASSPKPAPATAPFPVTQQHEGLTLVAHGGAFAGARLDIGTRVLLEVLDQVPAARSVVDLGCGTGALAVSYALAHPEARVIATDRSAAAVASARATAIANRVADRVEVTHDDAGAEVPDASVDLVLLNPPFHLGTSVHTGAATRLFEAAARMLRTGGELWTVYNSSLGYRAELNRLVGPTEQVVRTPKFTVTRSLQR